MPAPAMNGSSSIHGAGDPVAPATHTITPATASAPPTRRRTVTATTPPGPYPMRSSTSPLRSEEHTSELQSLMRLSYAVFCLKKKKKQKAHINTQPLHSAHKTYYPRPY